MTLERGHAALKRMLVVDDHAISAQHAVSALRQHPAEVQWVKTAAAAIAQALHWRPDVVITDRHLPDSDGLALLQRIRNQWPAERPLPKFIVMTADRSGLAGAAVATLGVESVLVKPVSGREIREAAGIAAASEVNEPGPVDFAAELRTMFRDELEQRMPDLDTSLSALDRRAAASTLHQLIASAAICGESGLESSLRALNSVCRRGASPGDIAGRYQAVLEFAREFISRPDPR